VPRVLLCTRAGAPEVPAVVDALRNRDMESVIMDSAAFPSGLPLSLSFDHAVFRAETERDSLHQVSAVWQSLVVGADLPEMQPGVRETCVTAAEHAVIGMLDSLEVFQLDPYWAKARADNKPAQLRIAQRVGLELPPTLITNDPDAVRAFAARSGPIITKMLVQPLDPVVDGEAAVVFTTALTAEDLARLEGLELCPMIFQARIANRRDVRVTVVGKRVFGAALETAARGGDDPDWRRQSYALDRAPVWTPCELSGDLVARVRALLDQLGLNYGAVDFIEQPDGRLVFLELNASGAFAFLGPSLAPQIADAIAELLVDPAARRVHGRG
jgi:glutathione synthase/RimK-type ligase-like ATP-grasp enzyme